MWPSLEEAGWGGGGGDAAGTCMSRGSNSRIRLCFSGPGKHGARAEANSLDSELDSVKPGAKLEAGALADC